MLDGKDVKPEKPDYSGFFATLTTKILHLLLYYILSKLKPDSILRSYLYLGRVAVMHVERNGFFATEPN